jgi:DUF1680 family protein
MQAILLTLVTRRFSTRFFQMPVADRLLKAASPAPARPFATNQAYVMVAVLDEKGEIVSGFEAEKCFADNEDRSHILPKNAEPYGGRETISDKGRYSLAGQALGHYLSTLSHMASATGDKECRRRVDYIVHELSGCQKAAGAGILCAFPESKQIFEEVPSGQIKSDHLFNLNGRLCSPCGWRIPHALCC